MSAMMPTAPTRASRGDATELLRCRIHVLLTQLPLELGRELAEADHRQGRSWRRSSMTRSAAARASPDRPRRPAELVPLHGVLPPLSPGASLEGMSTRLSSIAYHHLSVECACGRHELLPVTRLLTRYGDLSLEATRRRLWCSRCGQHGVVELRIIHVGGSRKALSGDAPGLTAPPSAPSPPNWLRFQTGRSRPARAGHAAIRS